MNYICTWICVDEKGEESLFPQTGKLSSSQDHQDIYWRCVLVFFLTSMRFNKHEKHLLFTNARHIPCLDGRDVRALLTAWNVDIIQTDFKYKTPRHYYFSFQNQFYEFSILEHIAQQRKNLNDTYLILDADCIFIKPAAALFTAASHTGFISFEDDVQPGYVINGLSRNDLKTIFEELLQRPVDDIPAYHLGEFFLASYENIEKLFADFTALWPILLQRHAAGLKKFNEEAHTLSYLYYKNGLKAGQRDTFMKRIWTNPAFYRNVSESDTSLAIWHLPAEKTYGLHRLYDVFMNRSVDYGLAMPDEKYIHLVQQVMGIPYLTHTMRWKYYTLSYYRALKKRWLRLPLVRRFTTTYS